MPYGMPQRPPARPMARQQAQHRGFGAFFNPAAQAQQAALAQAVAMKRAQAGSLVEATKPTKSKKQYLPLNSTGTIAANSSQTITARPQAMAYKPTQYVIPATIAPFVTITDIKIGNQSQFVQAGDLPGEIFVQNSEMGMFDFDTAQTSQDVVVVVNNITGAAITFRSGFLGTAIYPG
jgi:hypothetical protein